MEVPPQEILTALCAPGKPENLTALAAAAARYCAAATGAAPELPTPPPDLQSEAIIALLRAQAKSSDPPPGCLEEATIKYGHDTLVGAGPAERDAIVAGALRTYADGVPKSAIADVFQDETPPAPETTAAIEAIMGSISILLAAGEMKTVTPGAALIFGRWHHVSRPQ
jgi:hypothetical protein